MACVDVSALGNWSHKSNSLSEVVVGLLENMKGGSRGTWGGRGGGGGGGSQSFTHCITH